MTAVHPGPVVLSGPLALRDSAELAKRLANALDQHTALVVDATGVTAADMAIVQLFLAARRSALAAGKPFELRIGRSGALRELLTQAGFAGTDGLPLFQHQGLWAFTSARSQAA